MKESCLLMFICIATKKLLSCSASRVMAVFADDTAHKFWSRLTRPSFSAVFFLLSPASWFDLKLEALYGGAQKKPKIDSCCFLVKLVGSGVCVRLFCLFVT